MTRKKFVFAGFSKHSDTLQVTIPYGAVSVSSLFPLLGHEDTTYFVKQRRYVGIHHTFDIDRAAFAADVLSILCGIMGLNIAEVDVAISEQFDLTDLQRYALACGIQTYAMFAPMNPPDVAPSSVITRGTAPAYWLCES